MKTVREQFKSIIAELSAEYGDDVKGKINYIRQLKDLLGYELSDLFDFLKGQRALNN